MAREDERILESFVNRGVANIGSRELQRANAPTLSASLAEANATRSAADESRKRGLLRQVAANPRPSTRQPSGGSQRGGSPTAILEVANSFKQIANGSSTGEGFYGSGLKPEVFTLRQLNANNASGFEKFSFANIREVQEFLNKNPEIAKGLGRVAGDPYARASTVGGGNTLQLEKILKGSQEVDPLFVRDIFYPDLKMTGDLKMITGGKGGGQSGLLKQLQDTLTKTPAVKK